MIKSCFLRGLKRELQFDVKLLTPSTMHDVISIALQVNAKFNALKPMFPRHATILKPHAPVLPQLPTLQPKTPTFAL